jgi:hypothetical protein
MSCLGTYAMYERARLPVADRRGRLFYGAFGAGLCALGLCRLAM